MDRKRLCNLPILCVKMNFFLKDLYGMARHAFVYYAHDVTPARIREIRRLEQELPDAYDLFVTGKCADRDALAPLASSRTRLAAYVAADLLELPYPGRHPPIQPVEIRGDADLTLLKFWLDHPDYDFYWFVEYDVRFTGHWAELLSVLDRSQADLLCAMIDRYRPQSRWPYWSSFKPGDSGILPTQMMSGFIPICRATPALMSALDRFCRGGGSGHVEVVWGSVANAAGLKLEEIGGDTAYTPRERRHLYYGFADVPGVGRMGNYGAWPFYSDRSGFIHRRKNLLWHPVKD